MKGFKIALLFSLSILLINCSKEEKQHTETSFVPFSSSVVLKINRLDKAAALVDSTNLEALNTLPIGRLQSLQAKTWTGALAPSGADKMNWVWSTTLSANDPQLAQFSDNTISPWDSVFILRSAQNIAWSTSEGLLQDLQNQNNNGIDLWDHAGFSKLWQNASSKDAFNLFLQHSELPAVGNQLLDTDLSWAAYLASWTEIDIAIRKSGLIMNSVSLCSDSSNTFLSTLDSRAKGTDFSTIIASSSNYALTAHMGNTTEWMRDFNGYRGRKQRLKKARAILDNANIDPMLASAQFTGAMFRAGYGEDIVLGLELESQDQVTEMLEKLSMESSLWKGMSRGTLKESHKFLFSGLFGWFFSDLKVPSYLIKDRWLLLSSDPKILEVYTGEILLDKNWNNTASLSVLADQIDQSAHFNIALPLKYAEKVGLVNGVEESNWSTMNLLAQLNIKDDLAFGTVSVQQREKQELQEESTYLWSASLEAEVAHGPWLVQNHRTGQKNIVVQDQQNTLYWVDETGAILWKTTLNEPIVGEMAQVDLFKNNKFQLLFTTSSELHCFDLLGRKVENYPISLPAKTDIGVSVLDYDKNRNYRFLVACGAKLYNYTSDGKLVKGWKTDAAEGTIIQAPLLYQKNNKDYIITSTLTQPLVLNRRGESRINTKLFDSCDKPWKIKPGAIPSIVRIGNSNEIQRQSWDGQTAIEGLGLSNARGLVLESYGQIAWNDEEVLVQSEGRNYTIETDGIESVETYPGGTGVIFTNEGTILVHNLITNESLSTFSGSLAKAGRLSPTGKPVLVIGQTNSLICYEL